MRNISTTTKTDYYNGIYRSASRERLRKLQHSDSFFDVGGIHSVVRKGSTILEIHNEAFPDFFKSRKAVRVLSNKPKDIFESLTVADLSLIRKKRFSHPQMYEESIVY